MFGEGPFSFMSVYFDSKVLLVCLTKIFYCCVALFSTKRCLTVKAKLKLHQNDVALRV